MEGLSKNERLAYTSTRLKKEKLGQGDVYDILYESDAIDVKGTHGVLNEKYFYNHNFLVFDKQLEDRKIENISHFCFVLISPDYKIGWIHGVITLADFLEKSVPVQLQWANHGIRSRELKPFIKYIFRTS